MNRNDDRTQATRRYLEADHRYAAASDEAAATLTACARLARHRGWSDDNRAAD